jgi:hypothetical protein
VEKAKFNFNTCPFGFFEDRSDLIFQNQSALNFFGLFNQTLLLQQQQQ